MPIPQQKESSPFISEQKGNKQVTIQRKTFIIKKRRDAEAQRFFSFDREHPECAEIWPTSRPMTHIKTPVGRFTLQVSIKTLKKKPLRLSVSALEIKRIAEWQHR